MNTEQLDNEIKVYNSENRYTYTFSREDNNIILEIIVTDGCDCGSCIEDLISYLEVTEHIVLIYNGSGLITQGQNSGLAYYEYRIEA